MKYQEIKETPFILIQDEDNNVCFTACSNVRVSEIKPLNENNIKELIKESKEINWKNLITVISILIEKTLENGRNKKN